jgi:hypothetical protein
MSDDPNKRQSEGTSSSGPSGQQSGGKQAQSKHVSLLEETLQEEKDTDEKLTELGKEINLQASEEQANQEVEVDEEDSRKKPARRSHRRVA